ncbi:hypothetical protein [Sinanaerobacter sp. ZZT-01]|uniref:hypothetical protein n=1 Tax=Sinanaerobacter sp. ZZT-01 TaxID=3111540 RepID=UPI002D777220|nr:hypothetical protein [Sinanaerobacter sp. ZZT-01]WRR94079.1 hypothetical protein U5921_02875 [Sinanaerobacter sp. ZZT-01]
MDYAIIENNKITNVIVSDKDFAKSTGAICCEGLPIGIGDEFENRKFKKLVTDYDKDGIKISEHYKYYDAPSDELKPTLEELQQRYDTLSIQYIHEKYSYDEENKIMREYLSDMTNEQCKVAFDTYNTYVEECKIRAYTEVYGN